MVNSYEEVFRRAQATGNYQVVLYSMENASNIDENARMTNLYKLISLTYKKIKEYEKLQNVSIIHKIPNDERLMPDPFVVRNRVIGLTVNRNNTNNDLLIDQLLNESLIELNLDYSFIKHTAYYNVDDWIVFHNNSCSRGNCIRLLTEKNR